MDNREYLKRLFSNRTVIRALLVTAAACFLSYLCAKLLTGQTAQSVGQIVCALLMFSQLLPIGKIAIRISDELQEEARRESRKPGTGKKKNKRK